MNFFKYTANPHARSRSFRFDFRWFIIRFVIVKKSLPNYKKVPLLPYYLQAIIY